MSEKQMASEQKLSHIAFIMDGNGRWAKQRGLPREHGHREGVKTFEQVIAHCEKLGVDAVTVYAFSTENWKRPKREVEAIMKLMDHYLSECEKKIDEYNMRICFLGDKAPFESKRRARMERLEAKTAEKTRILNIAFNYGGRDEIVRACNRLITAGVTKADEQSFSAALDTACAGDPDLIVRTGGDLRISNFLLWQAAYAELYFTDVLWPDFGAAEIDKAVEAFYKRKRRFGGV